MMSDIAIQVEGLSKQYKIGVGKYRHDSLRDHLTDTVTSLLRRNGRAKEDEGILWALKDVSFEVKQGEVLGIIGRNGAGKSTLLKILSRITEPTTGRAKVYGRLASLLEVGTGFHAELTGLENIYLNGAILGMRKAEIDRKLEEIIAFAEIERFIDTPVKRYSSGMYVRLAFAVAAHLEPEILIVDEVLAVGDIEFQKKCLGKMHDISREGRTVLFVSHNMAAVQKLTTRGILLENGQVILIATTPEVISHYMKTANAIEGQAIVHLHDHPNRVPGMIPALQKIWMTDNAGKLLSVAPMGGDVVFHVEYATDSSVRQPIVGLVFNTLAGERLFAINNKIAPGAQITNGPSKAILSCHFSRLPLVAGEYPITVTFAKSVERDFDTVEKAYRLTVVPSDVYSTGCIPEPGHGFILVDVTWKFRTPTSTRKPPPALVQDSTPDALEGQQTVRLSTISGDIRPPA